MTTIRATFRVTTPMFSRGASRSRAELRASSFKGVLRFWWRACAWSHFDGNLPAVRDEEERVFGGPNAGRSRVTIRLHPATANTKPTSSLTVAKGEWRGARYLGYGLIDTIDGKTKVQLTRECLMPPLGVTVELHTHGLSAPQLELLVRAVRALGVLGGMGARSRRGFGSLSLASLDGDVEPERLTSRTHLRNQLRDLVPTRETTFPAYTALSPYTRILVKRSGGTDALAALDQLGEEYKGFRDSAPMLGRDAQMVLHGGDPETYPKRVAFGLPVNYGKGRPAVTPAGHDRRASPLFFHIHDCDGSAVPVVAFLPARFLPDPRIRTGPRSGQVRRLDGAAELYRPVHEFLDQLSGPDGGYEAVWEGRR